MFFYHRKFTFSCISFLYFYVIVKINVGIPHNGDISTLDYNSDEVQGNCSENGCILQENITSFECHGGDKECLKYLCSKPHGTLRRLDLSGNQFTNIRRGCFSMFPSLEILNISNNEKLGLENLYNAAFGLDQTNIKELYANNINQVGSTYPFPRNISLLLLNTSLQILQLNYNEIQIPESGSIYYLPRSLKDISVRGNRLEISLIFGELVWLKNLTRLDISFQCSTREYRSRSRRNIHFIADFNNHTNYKDCPKDIGTINVLQVLPSNLDKLIATGMIAGTNCIPLLSTRNTSKLSYIDISRDGYYRWIGPIRVNATLNNVTTLNLSHNQCSYINDSFFDSLTKLKTLDISFNYLGAYFHQENKSGNVLKGLTNLENLYLQYNKISYLPKKLLKYNKGIKKLVISNNAIDKWTLDISHLDRLTFIDCSHNKLGHLPDSVTKKLDELRKDHNVTVDFHHNRIACTCDNLQFLNWLFTTKVMVTLSAGCTGYDGNITQAFSYLLEECSKDHSVKDWLYPVQTICLLFILFVIAVVIYKKRWALIYRWYLFRLRRKGYTPIGGCDEGYQFDAFLSFADEDRAFVERVVSELEENSELHFKVCVHYRDFTPGKSINKNIVSAVHSSKKTIIFISRAYLKSQWCKYELQMAITEERHMDRRLIIMVVLEDIPHNQLSLEVLQYYKKNSYIVKPKNEQELNFFWKTLKGVVANDL
ncbi:toll-like receptor 4 [Crassostrea angulata]|uniref:toll-like receptor 4 n=1 Tax=Magallana angulata TaxID=2784310 RepID=UPI0022B1204F|nr:toll-like receptor 4 [Crassostrea angulata]